MLVGIVSIAFDGAKTRVEADLQQRAQVTQVIARCRRWYVARPAALAARAATGRALFGEARALLFFSLSSFLPFLFFVLRSHGGGEESGCCRRSHGLLRRTTAGGGGGGGVCVCVYYNETGAIDQ